MMSRVTHRVINSKTGRSKGLCECKLKVFALSNMPGNSAYHTSHSSEETSSFCKLQGSLVCSPKLAQVMFSLWNEIRG